MSIHRAEQFARNVSTSDPSVRAEAWAWVEGAPNYDQGKMERLKDLVSFGLGYDAAAAAKAGIQDEGYASVDFPAGLVLNKRYRDSGSSRYYTFVRRGDQLVSQFRGGDVVGTYGCGMKDMEQDPADPSRFVTRCASGMGMESVAFSFGVTPDGRAYVDVAGGYRDEAERFYADTRRTYTCAADDAVALAADYFAPACSFDSSYAPYDHVALNPHGREAFVMPSCAGPRTGGRITYLLVERRTPCQAIGTISGLYDPAPVFTLSPDEGLSPRRIGGEEVHWAAPYILTVETSSGTLTYTFDWDAQEYRRSD